MAVLSVSQALNMALREEMGRDDRVFMIGEDIKDSTYGVTRGLWDEFGPKRVIGTPISEIAIAGAVLGAASVGMRPVAEFMYMTFMMCAMDQVVNQAPSPSTCSEARPSCRLCTARWRERVGRTRAAHAVA